MKQMSIGVFGGSGLCLTSSAWAGWGILLVPGAVIVLFVLERLFPLRQRKAPAAHRLLINMSVSLTTLAVALLLVRPAAEFFMDRTAGQIGIIPLLNLSGATMALVAFLLMDLTFYYWHLANHKIPLLWRFHNVHHIDPDLDVSTGFRFHPGEVAISAVFRSIQVLIIGVPASIYILYETLFQIGTYFHHSNLRLPLRLEQALNLLFVTPRMHGIHHSNFRNETDSNYSVVFSLWDRLHRTLGLGISQSEIIIGVPGYRKEDNRLKSVFMLPLARQRNYWQDESGRFRLSRGDEARRTASMLAF